ncbi:MAG: NAD-dependent epimerase/dehydratase family protein, partial [Geodermatophilaceae bacterium]|nr:NAD-dependent epimerase/dehydratase family protein [Geodermatophilaceae bacterium]
VIGVDAALPDAGCRQRMGTAEFVRADIRSPLISRVIDSADIDTVVHASASASPANGASRTMAKEMNVLGTMQLLAACQRADTVRRLVVKSTTAVYGSSPRDPAMFTEDMEPRTHPASGYAKDAMEIEGYVRGFARRRPDVDVSVLRFANFIGPNVESVLTEYFSLPLIPTFLGFDPRIQLLHEADALDVLVRATTQDLPGVVNVAAAGVLRLSQAIRRAGRVSVPVPGFAATLADQLLRRTRALDYTPEQRRFLNHGRVVDTTRLTTTFGFTPHYSTVAAFDDFVRGRHLRSLVDRQWLDKAERCVDRGAATVRAFGV